MTNGIIHQNGVCGVVVEKVKEQKTKTTEKSE